MGEILKFFARGSALVSSPGVPRITGSRPHYVGRDFVPATEDDPAMHPANAAGITVDTGTRQGRKHANQLVRHMRQGSLWGDAAACRFAGMRHEEFHLAGGVNVAGAPQHKSQAPKEGKKGAKE